MIRISLELVKLDKSVKLPLKIKDIVPYEEIKNNFKIINDFLNEQGFKTIVQRLQNNSFIRKENDLDVSQEANISKQYITINKVKDLKLLIEKIKQIGIFAIDTETNSLNIEKARIVGISICFHESSAYYIPINHKNSEKKLIKDQIIE